MLNPIRKEFKYGNDTVVMETGKVARQATGAVVVNIGGTSVLTTVVGRKSAKSGQEFFPLTVNYQEKTYAAGKIPGGFFKREGRPTEKETLTSRLIDRPIRPLFPKGFMNEVQVVCSVISWNVTMYFTLFSCVVLYCFYYILLIMLCQENTVVMRLKVRF